jgi:hypothetical protein
VASPKSHEQDGEKLFAPQIASGDPAMAFEPSIGRTGILPFLKRQLCCRMKERKITARIIQRRMFSRSINVL